MILKWIFDRIVALIGLLFLWPVLLVVTILIKVKMPGGPVFFVQKRVGKDGMLFDCHKFRTMTVKHNGSTVSVAGDCRITPFGATLRHYKLDELPGLWDVLIGNMSFVGPRPDVPGYADKLTGEDRKVLELRPGITGPATLKYRLEDEMLANVRSKVEDGRFLPKEQIESMTDQELVVWYNDKVIYPDKVRINLYYLKHYSFWKDIYMILATVFGWDFKYEELESKTIVNKAMNKVYLCLAHMSETGMEQKYVKEAFDTNWVVPLGPNVNGFESDLKSYFTPPHLVEASDIEVVALSAGTAAVHLALIACGVKPEDEVIVQSFTFCASSHPVTYLGATPVFVDSEPDTWNMDPQLLEEAIKDRIEKTGKKPQAIVSVYLYGMPAKIDEIMAIGKKYDIPIIEDAAEGFGSKYHGQMCGTFGEYGVLSFNGNKMITTSGGGALICPSKEDKDRIMWYATQAREAYPYYQHKAIGYNYRMSNICAGIGRGQMTVADDHIRHHRHVAELYRKAFENVDGITFHDEQEGMESNFWLSTILLDENLKVKNEELAYATAIQGAVGGAAGVVHGGGAVHTDCEPNKNVEAMRLALDKEGIESRPLWKPMHKQPVYKNVPAYVNGVSESLFKRGLCLPSGPMVSDDDVSRIVEVIKYVIVR